MIDAIARPDRGRAREGLRRRQLRLRQLVPRRRAARGARAAARPLRGLDREPGRAVHPRRLGRTREIAVTGVSFGAYHAANFALRHADLFPLAICQSGVYDVSVVGGGERGDAVYFNNPADYVANLGGDHLDWLRGRVNLLLICGQGPWEDSTGALESTRRFAAQLGEKGIRHELDVWGHDVPHDWPAWRAQIAHHLPRFV